MNVDPNKVKAVFLEAVEKHPSDAWDSFLREACDDNVDLRAKWKYCLLPTSEREPIWKRESIAGGPTLEQQV